MTFSDSTRHTMMPAVASTSLLSVCQVCQSVLSLQYLNSNLTGDTNESQILVAGKRYLDRPAVLESILNDLFHVFRYETCQNTEDALDILLLAMEG